MDVEIKQYVSCPYNRAIRAEEPRETLGYCRRCQLNQGIVGNTVKCALTLADIRAIREESKRKQGKLGTRKKNRGK